MSAIGIVGLYGGKSERQVGLTPSVAAHNLNVGLLGRETWIGRASGIHPGYPQEKTIKRTATFKAVQGAYGQQETFTY